MKYRGLNSALTGYVMKLSFNKDLSQGFVQTFHHMHGKK
jgi:hypothetical protein